MHVTEDAHVLHDKVLVLNRRLEALQAIPGHISGKTEQSDRRDPRITARDLLDSNPGSFRHEDEVLESNLD